MAISAHYTSSPSPCVDLLLHPHLHTAWATRVCSRHEADLPVLFCTGLQLPHQVAPRGRAFHSTGVALSMMATSRPCRSSRCPDLADELLSSEVIATTRSRAGTTYSICPPYPHA